MIIDTGEPVLTGTASRRNGRAPVVRPKVAVDIVLFALQDATLKTYLVRLRGGPLKGKWAFPGGLVRTGEKLDDAARRELSASTGLEGGYLEQLFTFGDPLRDPRAHVVSVAYMALIANSAAIRAPSAKYSQRRWFDISTLPPLAYDHVLMADYALARLKSKLNYSNVAFALLPEAFTFTELERLYANIFERPVDRRNFRRRMMATGLLRELPVKRRGPHRPATLFNFAQRSLQIVEMV